ncbi:uncharacterized protein STEHIDRAFT_107898 [Stereum hirsutum FP-91666 SS1]|uniref:uncharacterized protein n=1 Tax=Stereum hirsutum (strain FP-91666) TaxID=721885 RepID=UPI000440E58B|nr:uncharacterized protein STEHIDRAFT_107898 [Stereum hirsutum FP-91666 SS1]EIM91321.1 hypothetical protein STEHIDRAFT_107898 [Stereum hirsutum FP-91666 SS1]
MKFASSIIIAFIFAVQSALATTLYRNGGASKAYNSVRTPQDYDTPVKGLIPANSKKGMSTNSDKSKLPSQKKIYSIDSSKLTGILHPVNDHDTHWSITLTQATEESKLLDAINNAGWTKCAISAISNIYLRQSPANLHPIHVH